MKIISFVFLMIAIVSLVVLITVRTAENEWYENIEGQCGINDNGTCEGWQFSAIFISLMSLVGSLLLFFISNSYEKKSDVNVATGEGGEQ